MTFTYFQQENNFLTWRGGFAKIYWGGGFAKIYQNLPA